MIAPGERVIDYIHSLALAANPDAPDGFRDARGRRWASENAFRNAVINAPRFELYEAKQSTIATRIAIKHSSTSFEVREYLGKTFRKLGRTSTVEYPSDQLPNVRAYAEALCLYLSSGLTYPTAKWHAERVRNAAQTQAVVEERREQQRSMPAAMEVPSASSGSGMSR